MCIIEKQPSIYERAELPEIFHFKKGHKYRLESSKCIDRPTFQKRATIFPMSSKRKTEKV